MCQRLAENPIRPICSDWFFVVRKGSKSGWNSEGPTADGALRNWLDRTIDLSAVNDLVGDKYGRKFKNNAGICENRVSCGKLSLLLK